MDIAPSTDPRDSAGLRPIEGRYLLVIFNLQFYINAQGRRYLDKLWVKDLVEHFKYLNHVTLASPCRYEEPPEGCVPVDSMTDFANVQFIDLPAPKNTADALRFLPRTLFQLWKAVEIADIVHTGVAGWPIPEAWLLTPIVRFQRKFYLIIVESAFWRLTPSSPKSLKSFIRSYFAERGNRCCINHADLAIFTQPQYRQSLLTRNPEQGYVINASWIDEQTIISRSEAAEIWRQKRAVFDAEPAFRVLFAGRLIPSKGVNVLLDAVKLLREKKLPINIQVDILGQGELLDVCQKASQDRVSSVKVQLLGTIPYGPDFFRALQDYHAVVIPNISDEQPRIIYDAYSQGVPILGSDTDGVRDCVQDGKTGKLCLPSDPVALADLLQWASQNLNQLEIMGFTSLETALGLTHQEMHRRRWQILLERLDESQIMGSVPQG
jgi:glycosyltransferase involved in cell wall biosynthesis